MFLWRLKYTKNAKITKLKVRPFPVQFHFNPGFSNCLTNATSITTTVTIIYLVLLFCNDPIMMWL